MISLYMFLTHNVKIYTLVCKKRQNITSYNRWQVTMQNEKFIFKRILPEDQIPMTFTRLICGNDCSFIKIKFIYRNEKESDMKNTNNIHRNVFAKERRQVSS